MNYNIGHENPWWDLPRDATDVGWIIRMKTPAGMCPGMLILESLLVWPHKSLLILNYVFLSFCLINKLYYTDFFSAIPYFVNELIFYAYTFLKTSVQYIVYLFVSFRF